MGRIPAPSTGINATLKLRIFSIVPLASRTRIWHREGDYTEKGIRIDSQHATSFGIFRNVSSESRHRRSGKWSI